MKHIKKIANKYHLIINDGRFILIDPHRKESSLPDLMNYFDEKILDFTNNVEECLKEIKEMTNKEIMKFSKQIPKLPMDKLTTFTDTDDTNKVVQFLFDVKESREEIISQSFSLMVAIKEGLNDWFDRDIDFLNFSVEMLRARREMQEAVKVQELTLKRIRQLSGLIADLYSEAEDEINSKYESIFRQVDERLRYMNKNLFDEDGNLIQELVLSTAMKNDNINEIVIDNDNDDDDDSNNNINDNNKVVIPRTSLELKKHLKEQGFVLDRHNGSHNIYKNEEGEVRIIPARPGNHVLAAKTAKKIYQGVNTASN